MLLSRRGDLDVWNLPTGRLDVHEALTDAAAREAHEETGVQVEIERAVGLYYFQATQRMNVLYAGRPAGGALADKTDESTDNRYFPPTALPDSLFADYMVTDAARAGDPPTLHVHTTPPLEMLKLRLKLAQRWVSNLLSGRPEPRHVRFDVLAVCLVWDAEQQQAGGVSSRAVRWTRPRRGRC